VGKPEALGKAVLQGRYFGRIRILRDQYKI
jgi:hypothetical protein